MFKRLQPDPNRPHWSQLTGLNLRRLSFWVLLGLLLAVIAWLAYPRVVSWLDRRAFGQAVAFHQKGDIRSASLVLTGILERDPTFFEAAMLMADMAEKAGSPAALHWRRHIAVLDSNDRNNLAWANQAIRFGNMLEADRALSRISVVGRDSLEFHRAAAGVALLERDSFRAVYYLGEVARQEPTNALARLNLALTQIATENTALRAEAVRSLAELRKNPATRTGALRGLLGESERVNDTAGMLRLAEELARQTNSTTADRIRHVNALHASRSGASAPALASLQQAATVPADIYLIASWMTAHGQAGAAEAWLKTQPAARASQITVVMAMAECLLAQKRWENLRSLTQTGGWGMVEHLRLAYLARAMRQLGEMGGSQRNWNRAIDETANDQQRISVLASLALDWGWEQEADSLLWRLAQGGRYRTWALKALYTYYSGQRDTRRLLRVCRAVLQASPTDPVAKNNYASLSLLVNENVADARKLAEEVYKEQPANPGFAATYAFSLLGQGRTAEARAIMSKIPDTWMAAPSMAACYGLVLEAAGEKQLAFAYLDRAKKSGRLLPEEEVLVNATLARLR